MGFSVDIDKVAEKTLKKLDKKTSARIRAWIDDHLDGCEDPRLFGKPLTGNFKDCWGYRVTDYRLIAKIDDGIKIINIEKIDHRNKVYKIWMI
ncbi:MAG: type II toxin-antitoxin system RelE/ParE family toxin [Defluviitaleaceae bacterium]|nr:type II toxin-antitoxin system RelE/ParE family toxin [Defluviitaleaceae bacterium]